MNGTFNICYEGHKTIYLERKQGLAVEWQTTESDGYKELIRQLAYEWRRAELPGVNFAYTDYIKIIGGLLTATQDQHRTKKIFMAILKQAVEMEKTSLWVEREVKFETLAESIGRDELLMLELRHAPTVDDRILDLYNDRRRRFTAAN